jgi:hypothetical protein
LTDQHNSHGTVFYPSFGRTDPAYNFSRDFDVLITNNPADRRLLVAQWGSDRARYGRYELLTTPRWNPLQLVVIARRGARAVPALARACRCEPRPLTPTNANESPPHT